MHGKEHCHERNRPSPTSAPPTRCPPPPMPSRSAANWPLTARRGRHPGRARLRVRRPDPKPTGARRTAAPACSPTGKRRRRRIWSPLSPTKRTIPDPPRPPVRPVARHQSMFPQAGTICATPLRSRMRKALGMPDYLGRICCLSRTVHTDLGRCGSCSTCSRAALRAWYRKRHLIA